MKFQKYFGIFILIFLIACNNGSGIKIEVKNPIDKEITEQLVSVKLSELPEVNIYKLAAFDNEKEIPSQLVDKNADGKPDEFSFLVNLKANQTKIILLKETKDKKKFNKRAHAEISEKVNYKLVDGVYTAGKFVSVKKTKTPEGHKDHNLFYKCEGPCWESDKVAYRLYLDQRNAIDIFGKKVHEIVMPEVGHTYNSSGNEMYHEMADWGMDIFKVGHSLGIGSFAAYVNGKVQPVSKTDSVICTIDNDGPIFASVNIKYYGWKFDNQKINFDAELSITAGSRLTECNLSSGNNNYYCTGLAKHENTEFFKSKLKKGWNYIALWGKQTVIHDNLGIVIFYNSKFNPKLLEDDLNYIVTFKPDENNIKYYFAACWEQEENGIRTKEEFLKYLNEEIMILNNKLIIKVMKKQ